MWGDQNTDPGGTSAKALPPQELSELKDQNEQQLVLIAQLKEMLRKEQSTVSQDKVEEYVNTLNRARAKRAKQKRSDSSSSNTTTTSSGNIDAIKKERVNLLRQQLEENKARLAERGKSQKGIEEMVSQMQAQLKDSQVSVSSTPLNQSLVEAKNLDYNESTSQKELYNILLTKEKKITDLLNKSQKLEGSVLDLQENVKEKDSVIDARTKAITLMTDSLSKKGKNTLDALEETKDQMRMMQENFVTLEAEMKARQLSLLNDLKMKNFEIGELKEINGQLEKDKLELEQKLHGRSSPVDATDSLGVEALKTEVEQLELHNTNLLEKIKSFEKSSNYDELHKLYEKVCQENEDKISKISELEIKLQQTLSQLKNKEPTLIESSDPDTLGELKRTKEENEKLSTDSAKQLSKINELKEQLDEALSQLKDSTHTKSSNHEDVENRVLLEENERLSKENSENLLKIHDLEKQLEDALTDLKLLKNTGMGASTQSNKEGDEGIAKLKKQLDDSNKNMIKMRAVQKGKIKELNKKLDQFRKMNDSNALIEKLQNEIIKLNEKIAELEDEKGNLQLKMVDSSTSSKEDSSDLEEEIKQIKEKLDKTKQGSDEKDKVIEILEKEVLALKADLKQKSEEEIKVSSQVSSEMSSICYEEQIETLESEKRRLLEQLDLLNNEKENILQELELAKTEKQDLNAKLDSYIQENIELIDKLEKLSAEKVSSAESIEIVEGLTQQEKIELAAYQKHINPEESMKGADDDNIESPAELNESVLQLSEDTAELLQKIEMFTQERKEVMQKMEALKDENNGLALKISEIENNRDVLEETYEQIQNEKDALQQHNQELSDKLENIHKDEILKTNQEQSANILDSELKDLQIKYEALIQENDELKRTLKEFDSIVQEKYDLESRLRDLVENNTSLDTKLNSNLDEINTYQLTIEDNKTELTNSGDTISKLQSQLEERENDIQELHINITELNSVISELQGKQSNFDILETELENLKSSLTTQITQADDYESEISQNSDIIKKLNEDLITMNRRILELQNELELKDSEIGKLKKDISNKGEIIQKLYNDIGEKDNSFRMVSEDMKEKYLELMKQLENNDGTLQKQVSDLSIKNKEQLEKMKKIAANLKKKTQAYQELAEQYKSEKEKWEIEDKEKNNSIETLKNQVLSTTHALEESETRLNNKLQENVAIQNELGQLREQIEILEQNNADQQHYIQELKHKQEKLHETSLQQEMSASLHEDIDNDFPKHIPDDKIRELELLLETNESELCHYKERVDRLQDDARKLQEAKSKLEVDNAELVEKLNLTSNSFKDKALLEDQLELRLAEVTANDEALTKKLQESQSEREDLLKKTREHEDLIRRLKIKLKKAHDKVTELKTVQTNLQDLETVNQELKNQVASLEDNQRHIQSENESLQRRNMSDYEKIEADYQIQLEELLKLKNDLTTDNEKLLERVKELEDREQELAIELDEYKLRLEQTEKNNAEEVKLLKEKLETENSLNRGLTNELNDVHSTLQVSGTQVANLREELNTVKEQLRNIGLLQAQLESLTSEKNNLTSLLEDANDNVEKAIAESSNLQQALQQSNNALQASAQEVHALTLETEQLKQEILALEFAKSSLEASCESSQKLQINEFQDDSRQIALPKEISMETNDSNMLVPNYQWSDQPQAEQQPVKLSLLVNFGQQQTSTESKENLLLKEVNDKLQKSVAEKENLEEQLGSLKDKHELALQQANSLTAEIEKLREEVHALQFAKSSLEASYESSQKPIETSASDQDTHGILEEFSHQIVKLDNVEQSAVPLFNAFAQPTSNSLFDNLGATNNRQEELFDQSSAAVEPDQINQAQVLNLQGSLEVPLDTTVSVNQMGQPQAFSTIVDDGREALLKKIKALEFLLYNVDKEKEIALEQCTEMVNELTQLIYDKASMPPNQGILKSNLESQILSPETVDTLGVVQTKENLMPDLESQILSQETMDSLSSKSMQDTLYTPLNQSYGEQSVPVNEDIIQPKKAYICFDEDEPKKKGNSTSSDIESQIISAKDVSDASSSKKELMKLEYEKVDDSLGEQQQLVVEPLAQPKHAYLCYTKDDKPQSLEAFEENDDGWGWGPEEARLEEEHMTTLENIPQVKTLLIEIQQLKETIKVLQIERDNHLGEIKQLQVKSGKLIRKCKELKAKSGQASTSKKQDDGGFFDLNETIQEELKSQVEQLEKKLKDLTTEHEKEKTEKNNLLKRVDVLTAANDRMIEMKEIQDSEVFRWQRKHEEAVQKLQGYEWGSDGFSEAQRYSTDTPQPSTSGSVDHSSKIKELENTIKDLSLDNEELQTLLEEQNAKRLEAEKNKNCGNETELSELRSLNETLHKELNEVKSKTGELQEECARVVAERDNISQEKGNLENAVHNKEIDIQALQQTIEDLSKKEQQPCADKNEVYNLRDQISSHQGILHEKDFIIGDLEANLAQLVNRKIELDQMVIQLSSELRLKTEEIERLQSGLDQEVKENVEASELRSQIDYLNSVLLERDSVIENLNESIEKLNMGKLAVVDNYVALNNKLQSSEEAVNKLTSEREQRELQCQETLQNLQVKILEVQEGQAIISDLQERLKQIDAIALEKAEKDKENRSLLEQLEIKSRELEEKQLALDVLQLKLVTSNQDTVSRDDILNELDIKVKEIKELKEEKLAKDVEIQRLLTEVQNKEQEFQERVDTLVKELNDNWQAQVDQRGADVAESWKMHLEMVDKDYSSAQEKFKSDLFELEGKCNILVNENNELRKNVDQEIRNEVDKMTVFQQQISNLQQTINSLNQTILDKDKHIEEIQNNLSNYLSLESELQTLRSENAEKENKLASINIIIETTQKQFDEKRAVVEAIVSILEKQAISPISYEKVDILREFQRQLELTKGKESEIDKVTQSLHELEEKLARVTGEKSREITGLNEVIEDLEKDLSIIHEKEAEIMRLSTELSKVQEENIKLVQEISFVNQEKSNLLLELEKIKQEHSNCLRTVEDCNQKVHEYYNEQQSLKQTLEERNKHINNLNHQLFQLQDGTRNDSNREIENLNIALAKMKEDYSVLQDSLSKCENKLQESMNHLAQKTDELQKANENIIQYQQHSSYYDQENNRLTNLLDQREKEYNNSLEMLKNNQLADVQRHYDELLSNRELDINILSGQVQELVTANQSYGQRLKEEVALKQQVEQQLSERTQLVDEDTKQLEELKLIIEDQVAKIEELKKELFDKSNQYDSLIAEMDVGRLPVTRQPAASAALNPLADAQQRQYADDDLSEPVNRAELDLALYMLHQRDVRCEELTVELTHLLEERDTLQLRLSNVIREKEELRTSAPDKTLPVTPTSSSIEGNLTQSKSSDMFLAASGTELAKDPLDSELNLASKLSQLRIVGYKKDKTFVDEQEARRFQQLAIMQQHINEASKLPPEAAAKLVDASYTLSRDVQSPSKVLLNWLWGKSPPKANDS